jgi:hypothetical protein
MSSYTVYEPPLQGEGEPHPDRFVFVRDGFVWSAFLFAPVWMLRYRLWLALLLYIAVLIAISLAANWLRLSGGTIAAINFFVALLIGFEAATLRRRALVRRKWANIGVVVGDDLELAERRFFDAWAAARATRTARPRSVGGAAGPARAPAAGDVIGLFPEPGGGRP